MLGAAWTEGPDFPGRAEGEPMSKRLRCRAGSVPVRTSTQPWLVVLLAAAACSSTPQIDDLGQYTEVPMNKVYPYPSEEELAERTHRVAIEARTAAEVDPTRAQATHDLVRLRVEDLLALVGASLVPADGSEFAPDADGASAAAGPPVARPARRLDLVVRVDREDYSVTWDDPTNWWFQSEEEMAKKPGTCTHRAEIEIAFSVVDPARPAARPKERFTLRHSGEAEVETVDPRCPYADERIQGLFDTVVDEAMACARLPIQNAFASRGYVLEQRSRPADDFHLFRTSLGSGQGAEEGLEVGVFRVQYSTSADGTRESAEHRIAGGRVTDHFQPDASWIRVDVTETTRPILQGDLVRPVYRESTTSGLNPFGGCSDIFSRP